MNEVCNIAVTLAFKDVVKWPFHLEACAISNCSGSVKCQEGISSRDIQASKLLHHPQSRVAHQHPLVLLVHFHADWNLLNLDP